MFWTDNSFISLNDPSRSSIIRFFVCSQKHCPSLLLIQEPYLPLFYMFYMLLIIHYIFSRFLPRSAQGCNARKVISELYTSFVLQCTVSRRQCKDKTDVKAWHGIHLSHKKINEIFWSYYANYQNYQNLSFNLLGY